MPEPRSLPGLLMVAARLLEQAAPFRLPASGVRWSPEECLRSP